jgi:DMSO/TMAO reductase YedYZ molybdopterin-dependent catalytic subunit
VNGAARRPSSGRRTNLALLVLLAGAVATGGLAYATGTGWVRWPAVAHAIVGLAILALGPWKSFVVRRGLARARPGTWASVLFLALVLVAIMAGILHAAGLRSFGGGLTAMEVHVGAALILIPLAVWHVLVRRIRLRRTDFGRRALLRAGTVAAGSAVAYAAMEGLLGVARLPGRRRRASGSYEMGSFAPARMPDTQWLFDTVQSIEESPWRLRVRTPGSSRDWSYDEVSAFDDRVRATLDCTGGWYALQDWEGVRLARLLGEATGARSVLIRSRTGYSRRIPIADASHAVLATRAGGSPLSAGHGFPARLVLPGRRGFWWVKWVDEIIADDVPWWRQSPFPLQ